MFSKRYHRSHTRKYVGIVLTMNGFNYYVPFSSPKQNDFTENGDIKADNMFIARMVENDDSGNKKLLGTLRFNNMIPIPMLFICGYSIDSEKDEKYRDIIASEWKWITKNQKYICEKAMKIYAFKANELLRRNAFNGKRYDAILPFAEIENYIKNKY